MCKRTHKEAKMRIKIARERLTDGSFVYNVHIPNHVVYAEDAASAQRFADKLAELCNEANVRDDDAEVAFDF